MLIQIERGVAEKTVRLIFLTLFAVCRAILTYICISNIGWQLERLECMARA